jgi:hypothetical protein
MQEDHLHSEATLAITDPGAPAGLTAVQLFKRSLDTSSPKTSRAGLNSATKHVSSISLRARRGVQ